MFCGLSARQINEKKDRISLPSRRKTARLILNTYFLTESLKSLAAIGGLFIGLTIYGSMWSGAQDENENGWVIAIIWSLGIVTITNMIRIASSALSP